MLHVRARFGHTVRGLAAAALFALATLTGASARADFPSYVHVVREGETLASIAQAYYGDPRREAVLVAENGLEAEGGAAIVVGVRLVIPHVAYHRVVAGETWASIAEQYYGVATRSFAIAEANPSVEGSQPPEGAELLIPYPLRHVCDQRDTVNHLAQEYYGDLAAARTLRRFNNMRASARVTRGQVILVPLADLVLSAEGQHAVDVATAPVAPVGAGGEVRELQERIAAELPALQDEVRHGQYTEALAHGSRLLGAGELTGNQVVTIQRALAVCYVALGRDDLAIGAFREALARQPDLELDSRRTSPTVLAAFDAARHPEEAEPQDGAVDGDAATDADAGVAP
jgi:LysM repeat protein